MTKNSRAEHQSKELVKELRAFYSLSELAEREGITLDELYQEVTNILPGSWQYPEIACARIAIGNREFCTENFAQSPWRQSAPVKVHGSVVGGIDVGYLKDQPEQDEGPFLKEERRLLNAIAEWLGHITEHKQAEEALRESKELAVTKQSADEANEFAESIINTVREPLIALDQDLRVVSVSRSFYDFFKVKPEETVGQLIYDLGNKQWDIPKLRELLETILSQEATFDNYEVEHDFAGIGRRIMLLNARQIQRVLGKERVILLAMEDITERKRAEEVIRKLGAELAQREEERRDYAESIVDTVREPLIILDADLRVVSASRSFYQIFRVLPEETVGQLIYDLGDRQWDIPQLRELLEKILPEKTVFENMEIEHDFPGVGHKQMSLNARQVVGMSTQANLILLAMEDITERKRAEEVIRKLNLDLEERAEQLEDAAKELEAFSYSVSHDLRAPLRAIDGFSQLLLTSTAGHLDGEQQRLLEVIRSSTQQMGQLIADLLAFSRLGRQELRQSKVDMKKLVKAVFAELRSANPGRSLELMIDTIPPALGDPSVLRQVWFNLLSNAVKFTRGRDPARIEIRSQNEGSINRYSVKDNGVGFDMRYADKLFGVFQRLHSTREFEGTGVGLAIVQRVIHRLGGKVQAEGTVGEGATFAFTLPKGE
jgi:PAS domain S-box-containing protein